MKAKCSSFIRIVALLLPSSQVYIKYKFLWSQNTGTSHVEYNFNILSYVSVTFSWLLHVKFSYDNVFRDLKPTMSYIIHKVFERKTRSTEGGRLLYVAGLQ